MSLRFAMFGIGLLAFNGCSAPPLERDSYPDEVPTARYQLTSKPGGFSAYALSRDDAEAGVRAALPPGWKEALPKLDEEQTIRHMLEWDLGYLVELRLESGYYTETLTVPAAAYLTLFFFPLFQHQVAELQVVLSAKVLYAQIRDPMSGRFGSTAFKRTLFRERLRVRIRLQFDADGERRGLVISREFTGHSF